MKNRWSFPVNRLAPTLIIAWMLGGGATLATATEVFRSHHEEVLGTSLDLAVAADTAGQAAAAEQAVLGEVERLRQILSSYDSGSEISRLNAASGPLRCAPETIEVLQAYDQWRARSHGAFNGQLGPLLGLWHRAEQSGVVPAAAELQAAVSAIASPGWRIGLASREVTRVAAPGCININSLGKGYIVTKAAAAARRAVSGVSGILVNIGGDIFASGQPAADQGWVIGVADPQHSADNAPPLTTLHLRDRAISTSGAYERGYTIGGHRYSHILDPRTGQPAAGVASATVVADDNATANALATTLCVLTPQEGLALVQSVPQAECLIVTADGRQMRSERFAAAESVAQVLTVATEVPAVANAWPAGFEVAIAIDLKVPEAKPGKGKKPRKAKKPFVAVWVEDASGKRVRTVTVWGNEPKYVPELREWWKGAKADEQWAMSVTRATRSAGQHRIVWDGKDDQGKPLPQGSYTVVVEARREHGTYSLERGTIVCGMAAATGSLPAASEFNATQLSYGPTVP